MWCDTAYTYSNNNNVDAVGNVHITRGDTIHLYANKVFYNGDRKYATASGNVKLMNKSTVLTTDTLDYDLESDIAYYNDNGKIVDSTNILTSLIGKYMVDEDLIYFYKNVFGYSEKYNITGDTLIYNVKTGRIKINGPTEIHDNESTLFTYDGWYDSNTGEAELLKKSTIANNNQVLRADYIKYNKENGDGMATGNISLDDLENNIRVEGNNAVFNKQAKIASVTDSALLMLFSESDTLFLHADTLKTIPDSVEGKKIVMAYHNVRFFRTDIQGICDSLVYFSKDSLVQMFGLPVIWSDIHQLTADLIEMKQNIDAPDEIHLINNSFIISKQDSGRFDQIKGKNMIGYVIDKKLNNIDVDGNGQTLYYARDNDQKMIGLNRAESSNISILLKDGKIFKIAFVRSPLGQLKPMFDLNPEDRTLNGFDWKIRFRPLSRYDIFLTENPIDESKNTENKPAEN